MIKTHLFFDVTFRYNYRGQLGLGTTASVFVPQLVRGLRYVETWRTFISVERNFTVYSQCNILIPIFFFPRSPPVPNASRPCHVRTTIPYVKYLWYMLVVLVVYLPVPTTL